MTKLGTMEVDDGYNGSRVTLDLEPVEWSKGDQVVKLHVVGKPWMIRWVRYNEWLEAVLRSEEKPCIEQSSSAQGGKAMTDTERLNQLIQQLEKALGAMGLSRSDVLELALKAAKEGRQQ